MKSQRKVVFLYLENWRKLGGGGGIRGTIHEEAKTLNMTKDQ